MARYEHLPIYKKAMELGLYLQETVRNFSRYNKYTIGSDLRNLSLDIIKRVIRANSSRNKTELLEELVAQCETLKIMIVFAKEAKAFNNFKNFQHAAGLAANLCRQSEGWLQSSRKKSQNYQPPKAGR